MKLFILISIIFVFHQQGFTLKSKIKLDSNIDPFQFLGISDFKKDLSEYVPKKRLDSQSQKSSYNSNSRAPSIRLNSISDLPKLFESGDFNNIEGFKSMTRFLTEDDERLFDNGGIFDESGFDGVDQEASELYSKGSISREKERAKSASIIWLRKTDPMSKLEPYSCTLKQDEDLVEWAVYEVVMMCCSGNMEIKRVCISKNEELAMISFVLNSDDKCENRVGIAQEFIGKGLKYLKRIGMKNLAGFFIVVDKYYIFFTFQH